MNLGIVFKELLAAAKADEGKTLLPLIANAATSLAGNPTAQNGVAQGAKLLADAVAAQPNIGQDILKDLAVIVSAEAAALTPK
jgi:hypothetical protein